ncbi:SUMF1/EgtB/PvdO family nonheme iron enzyme [Bernardetia sp. MNP-M8]|uniref:formylglycine-generating enzyme family protein n=1 Tax=Bernardetia sp. MNP-M8 TaxID=3127470 RepID=UPI0030CC8D04
MKTRFTATHIFSVLLSALGLAILILGSGFFPASFDKEYTTLETTKVYSNYYTFLLPSHLLKTKEDTAGMVFVKGSIFNMGSTVFENEMPIHEVDLDDFYIGRYEVTVKQYREFCDATGRDMPKEPMWGWNDTHPVVGVTWDDASQYAEWAGKRLPTESEWEYAARGGLKTQHYTYAGANYAEVVGWYEGNSVEMVQPVGLKRPNELGTYDMSGNVWEWCSDHYGRYRQGREKNPKGVPQGLNRCIRGGSWFGNKGNLRTANRYYNPQGFGSNLIGFRVAMDK